MLKFFLDRVTRLTFVRSVAAFGWLLLLGLIVQPTPVFAENGGEGAVVETEALPESGAGAAEEGDAVKIRYLKTSNGTIYTIPDEPETPEQRAALEKLDPQARVRFEERRLAFLQRSLGILHKGKYVAGAGIYSKNKVVQVWNNNVIPVWQNTGGALINKVGSLFPKRAAPPEEKGPAEPEAPAQPVADDKPPENRSISELGKDGIQRIMRNINTQLYDHPDVVANSNEFGVSASLGYVAALGKGKSGSYNSMDFGVSIAYNVTRKEAAFEVYAASDTWVDARPGLAMLELRGRLQGSAEVRSPETPAFEKGRTMLFPFSSLTDNQKTVRAGISGGLTTGLLMPIYVELASNRLTLLRGTAGPSNRFFVGMPKGILMDAAFATAKDFDDVTGNILSRAARWAGNAAARCWAAMTSMGRKPPSGTKIAQN